MHYGIEHSLNEGFWRCCSFSPKRGAVLQAPLGTLGLLFVSLNIGYGLGHLLFDTIEEW